ncbi:PBECR4 domain-containing protein [Clostridium sp. C2-6-12]|uniref:PBECR4 domain-containing protein n=1 Tax=Clostridium sp. C2-6-12 TaxID=2698832 RepID=UPI00136C79FD|nr:PBECR4 domain-containing protein [Clostridium sp. C2-6-12]
MDKLDEVMSDYEALLNKTYKYQLIDKNELEVKFKTENFPHVIGLHKLVDIKDLEKLSKKIISGKKIYKELKKEITNEMIITSPHYPKIENKFNYFYKIKDLVFQKVIYDFDRSKLRTKIDADLVLYTIEDNLYIHLFLAKRKSYYAPMTFIVEEDDRYIKGQTDYDIKKLYILEKGKDDLEYIYIPDDDPQKESAVTTE